MKRHTLIVGLILGLAGLAPAQKMDKMGGKEQPVQFKVRIENITKGEILKGMNGGTAPAAIAPVLYVVHTIDAPLFRTGQKDWGRGLESLSEDGNPTAQAEFCKHHKGIASVGVMNIPVGETSPGPAKPGMAYEFSFMASRGQRLTTAEMFGQSNDLFYAPSERGIELFDASGTPVSGDITSQMVLWDAGTEVNEEPGFGPNQAPRQSAVNTGMDEHGTVRPVNDGKFVYPRVADVIKVTIAPDLTSADNGGYHK
jgi:hypothetical protein